MTLHELYLQALRELKDSRAPINDGAIKLAQAWQDIESMGRELAQMREANAALQALLMAKEDEVK